MPLLNAAICAHGRSERDAPISQRTAGQASGHQSMPERPRQQPDSQEIDTAPNFKTSRVHPAQMPGFMPPHMYANGQQAGQTQGPMPGKWPQELQHQPAATSQLPFMPMASIQQPVQATQDIRSARGRPGPLPVQPTGSQRSAEMPSHQGHTSREHRQRRRAETAATTMAIPQPESVHRPNAADSYLEHVQADPRIQDLLSGAPSKSIHTSVAASHPAIYPSNLSMYEKPLPDPRGHSRSHSMRTRTQQAPSSLPHRRAATQRYSLASGLHAHSHTAGQVGDGERYPPFPTGNGHAYEGVREHTRGPSYGSVDPATYALPA